MSLYTVFSTFSHDEIIKKVYQYIIKERYDLTRLQQIYSCMLFLESFMTNVVVIYRNRRKEYTVNGAELKKQCTCSSIKIILHFSSKQVRIHRQSSGNAQNLQDVKIHKKRTNFSNNEISLDEGWGLHLFTFLLLYFTFRITLIKHQGRSLDFCNF